LAKNDAEVELFSPDSLCIELSSDSAPTGNELANTGGELWRVIVLLQLNRLAGACRGRPRPTDSVLSPFG
jgi:hypothetical protein